MCTLFRVFELRRRAVQRAGRQHHPAPPRLTTPPPNSALGGSRCIPLPGSEMSATFRAWAVKSHSQVSESAHPGRGGIAPNTGQYECYDLRVASTLIELTACCSTSSPPPQSSTRTYNRTRTETRTGRQGESERQRDSGREGRGRHASALGGPKLRRPWTDRHRETSQSQGTDREACKTASYLGTHRTSAVCTVQRHTARRSATRDDTEKEGGRDARVSTRHREGGGE